MDKNRVVIAIVILTLCSSFSQISTAVTPGQVQSGDLHIEYRNITVYAPAVAQTENGYVGVISTITATIQSNGSGRVFVDTLPLTQVDMQGSARLAVKVASSLVKRDNISADNFDYFFVIRTDSPIIGGPSAGAVMTLATIALLENWTIADDIVMTGMINPDGSIGPIGGILHKIDAAASVGAKRFLIPNGQMMYTEMVTETTSSNGWWQTITKPVTRNVSDYARDNYGIEVYEVKDINDVLLYATGHYYPTPKAENQITTEDYISSMKPLAEKLLDDAQTLFTNASEDFDNSNIPNHWPYYYKNQVADYLNYAESYLDDAEAWYQTDLYYSSASSSFKSLINSRFVTYACDYFDASDSVEYIYSLYNKTKILFNTESDHLRNHEINDMISLQCVGIAQKKSLEAKKYLDDVSSDINSGDYLTALYKIAFAMERIKSVDWWLNLTSQFEIAGEIDNTTLTVIAEEYIDNAQQTIAYASVLLQEMGKYPAYLSNAEGLIVSARDAEKQGFPAAALFKALEALVQGNLALELVDGVTDEKIERARESASISISEARQQGVEPILSVSYYELAETLTNESSYEDAMFQYKYSDLIAGVVSSGDTSGVHSSRYIGIPENPVSSSNSNSNIQSNSFNSFPQISLLLIVLIIGVGLGSIIGITICRKYNTKKLKTKTSVNETLDRENSLD